jgi:hypothetical protein
MIFCRTPQLELKCKLPSEISLKRSSGQTPAWTNKSSTSLQGIAVHREYSALDSPEASDRILQTFRLEPCVKLKPINSAADALSQVITYRTLLSRADPKGRSWHLGSADEFMPPTPIILEGGLRVAYVAPPLFGVIVYFVADARDAFDLSLLAASRILPALLSRTAAQTIARPSNVISISRGVGISNAASQAANAEIQADVGVAELEDAA